MVRSWPSIACRRRVRKRLFWARLQRIAPVWSAGPKNSSFSFSEFMIVYAHPASWREAYRGRHDTWRRGVMGEPVCSVVIRADEQHRLVRSSRVVLIPRCRYQACAGADSAAWVTVTNKPGAPGRTRSSRENHRAGRAGSFRLDLWYLPPAFFEQAGHGPQSRSGLPCTLSFEEGETTVSLGRLGAARLWTHIPICRSELSITTAPQARCLPSLGGGMQGERRGVPPASGVESYLFAARARDLAAALARIREIWPRGRVTKISPIQSSLTPTIGLALKLFRLTTDGDLPRSIVFR